MLVASALGLGLVLSVNLTVRSLGGDVPLLGTFRLRDRIVALAYLGRHLAFEGDQESDARAVLLEAARRHGVSPRLVLAVAEVESSFVHTRVSGTGAMGLMQLMPATARELGVRDPFDMRDNADGGVRYLKQLLRTFGGNVERAVAAYNAGPTRVAKIETLKHLPSETRVYITRVASRM